MTPVGTSRADTAQFAAAVKRSPIGAHDRPGDFSDTLSGLEHPSGAVPGGRDREKGVAQLEELFIRQTLERVLPRASGRFYGKGLAGDVWRGMLADGFAKALSGRDHFGLRAVLAPRLTPAPDKDAP